MPHADVDWARYNQQVLFVDSSDTVRARMAAGLMEIVANWNGWGMVLVTDRCGVHAQPGAHLDPSMAAGLLARAGPMGISSRHFTRTLQVFEVDDLYRYDLIVALDAKTKAAILEMAAQETQTAFTSRYLAYFQSKIAQLSDFNAWCSDEHLARKGGNALLPRKLSLELVPALSRTRAALDIARPDLSSSDGAVEWEDMQLSILLGVAGELPVLTVGKFLAALAPQTQALHCGTNPWAVLLPQDSCSSSSTRAPTICPTGAPWASASEAAVPPVPLHRVSSAVPHVQQHVGELATPHTAHVLVCLYQYISL